MSLFPLAPWQVWTLAALLLFIGEILTPGFVLACFALACLVPAAVTLFTPLGFQAQMGLFALSSLAVYVLLRPAVVRYLSSRESRIPSNAEALIGAAGRVVKEVPADGSGGYVKVAGKEWWAFHPQGKALSVGTAVVVTAVGGARIEVRSKAEAEEN
ncbi:NfeD family protein [Aminithiophilus ramosus]|uniref:NfeD family protein n=2 Tax=Synergistales TaxID=649776 RepID=A0A9Q7AAW8_9BACT|nr:NfeD family protein [Aminithiophilus ramosus]QTX31788.1 NfeD family protein [Aminithiophilus ramosus]QVL35610.1 NfeD family protein [Synergistota bacterium]